MLFIHTLSTWSPGDKKPSGKKMYSLNNDTFYPHSGVDSCKAGDKAGEWKGRKLDQIETHDRVILSGSI